MATIPADIPFHPWIDRARDRLLITRRNDRGFGYVVTDLQGRVLRAPIDPVDLGCDGAPEELLRHASCGDEFVVLVRGERPAMLARIDEAGVDARSIGPRPNRTVTDADVKCDDVSVPDRRSDAGVSSVRR